MEEQAPPVDDVDTAELVEFRQWLQREWDPDLSIAEWWMRLADARYTVPHWPVETFGRGWSRGLAGRLMQEFRRSSVPRPPAGLGVMLAGPTLLAHGTISQQERFLPGIVSGRDHWCQLFSEPNAGSDLASVRTRAVPDGDVWRVEGQKVWTSNGLVADWGMLLARTDPRSTGRAGLTWFVIAMDQPGVEVRPLREMTGRSLFTEVFLDQAVVSEDCVVGAIGDGWNVARTTLMNERQGLSEGGAVGASPGAKAGSLTERAGDVAARLRRSRPSSGTAVAMRGQPFGVLRPFAAAHADDPVVRQRLAELYSVERVMAFTHTRAADARMAGTPGPAPSIGKLLHSRSVRLARDLGPRLLGPGGQLWGQSAPSAGVLQEMALFAPAVSIYGGTDEIQRNILAERVLGLPRDSSGVGGA